jgi:hypothetical protein
LSLNDISVFSVIRLPITADEINAFGPGLTFASLLEEQAQADQEATEPPTSPPTAKLPRHYYGILTCRRGERASQHRPG